VSTQDDTPKPRRIGDVDIQIPPSQGRMRIIVRLAQTAPEAAMCAAWGICSRGPGRAHAQWTASDPAAYGERVLDELLSRGAPYDEIIQAGKRAYMMIFAAILDERKVEDAAGNSEAPAAH